MAPSSFGLGAGAAAAAVVSGVAGIWLVIVIPCAWVTGSLSGGQTAGMASAASIGMLSQCHEQIAPDMSKIIIDSGLEHYWNRWQHWLAQGNAIRVSLHRTRSFPFVCGGLMPCGPTRTQRMVGKQSEEDLDWFATDSWGERLSSVPIWDSPDPPDYASFWVRRKQACSPLLAKMSDNQCGSIRGITSALQCRC